MIFHENRLPADDSHEISLLICYFLKSGKICNCRLLQIVGGALRISLPSAYEMVHVIRNCYFAAHTSDVLFCFVFLQKSLSHDLHLLQ